LAVSLAPMNSLPPAVPAPFWTPPDPAGMQPSAATLSLVQSQVRALLQASPAYHHLPSADQQRLADSMVKIAAYSAELVRDNWLQTERLGQRPLVKRRERLQGQLVRAQEDFMPAAANQVGQVTQETLKAIAFPTFVADLIKGTFEAITNSSIQQMESYLKLLENVGMTVDQFMSSNITDDQARDWLSQRYPDHIRVQSRKAGPKDGAEDRPAPDFQADLNLSDSVSLDEDGIESTLVPAARRRMAEMRLQMLSTLVLMGINRIVVTGGKIRATMLFHIDASDRLRQEHATDLDFRAAASGSYGFGPWSVSASVSFAYVNSSRSTSESDLNVSADLTGEVEIHFKSDYFPLERFAPSGTISKIQGNTAVPAANVPNLGETVPWGSSVQAPAPRQQAPLTSTLPPIGSPLPAARMPTAPTPPAVPPRSAPPAQKPTTAPAQQPPKAPAPSPQPHAAEPGAAPTAQPKPASGSQPGQQPTPTQAGAAHAAPAQPGAGPSAQQPPEPEPQPQPGQPEPQPQPAGAS